MPFMNLQRPREFSRENYYYNKEKETDQPHRIHFRRIRHSEKLAKKNPLRLLFAIILLLFVIYFLQKKADVWQGSSQPGRIEVEEIIVVD
ncbi:hypothetical protein EH223_19715 [candidate division KSB1 bacterium]|nr:hypothetical protein [candidate division KSB1 bacterium]RQW00171.1 MAG: hypothetical protein EH223_19715 [candidate division KSB1 bacterium]